MSGGKREKRGATRHKKRFKVEYGEDEPTTTGFGLDMSSTGLFVTATRLPKVGTNVHLIVTVGEGKFYAEAKVVRHRLVALELRSATPQGIGLRFLTPEELVAKHVAAAAANAAATEAEAQAALVQRGPAAVRAAAIAAAAAAEAKARAAPRLRLELTSSDAIEAFVREQVARGVAFVPCGEPGPPIGEVVAFDVHFADRPDVLEARGRVLQVIAPPIPGAARAVVELEDAAAITAFLAR